jgi:SAM-dependent methyltransferase
VSAAQHDPTTGAQVGRYFQDAAQIFDTFYDDQRTPLMRWIDRNFRRDMYERFDRTFTALTPLEGRTVLDVGCGSGPYAVECARRGAARVVGLDLAEGMLNLARERAARLGVGEKCTFIRGQFPDDAPAETFDYAIVMGVMDYIPDPLAFLRALAQCTRVRAVLSFPSDHWFRGPVRRVRYRLKRCPLWLYGRAQVADLLQAAGFAHPQVDKIPGAGMDYFAAGER